jgi:predicted permease
VSPEHFETLQIPLLEGRAFTDQDTSEATLVMIVNQAFARRYFDGRTPLGRKVKLGTRSFTVTGLARDSKYNTLTETHRPFFYMPYRQTSGREFWIAFFVRTAGPPRDWIGAVRREAGAVDANAGVAKVLLMEAFLDKSRYQQKVAAMLLSVLGVVSVLLAAVGLYSVMSYAVSRRTTEFGVRMALGAQTGDVLRLVVRQGLVLTLAGLILGGVAALAASRLVGSLLVNVSPADPVIFGGASLFLGVVAIAASLLPARRATKVDPVIALRCE